MTAVRSRIGPDLIERFEDLDDDPENDDEWFCTYCGGDGVMDNDDPVFYGHDDPLPCSACDGTGLRERQTIF